MQDAGNEISWLSTIIFNLWRPTAVSLTAAGRGALVLSDQSEKERGMEDGYENLTACCDGKITIEKLKRFQRAIVEFNEFVRLGAEMCRPVSDNRGQGDRQTLRD
jgi:hypothetical protein